MVPDDAIYANYTSQHDTEILSPTFFNKCINYDADSISTAMQNISAHLANLESQGISGLKRTLLSRVFRRGGSLVVCTNSWMLLYKRCQI